MSKLIKNIFIAAVILAVVATVIGGIMLLGSPTKERMRKLDERRIENLIKITNAINLYWTRHKGLPPSIEELSREPGINIMPLDPETGQSYEYKVLDEKNYQLFANFAYDTAEEQNTHQKVFWSHGIGRQCFYLEVKEADR